LLCCRERNRAGGTKVFGIAGVVHAFNQDPSPRTFQVTGHGIPFMHAVMDHVDISTSERGTTVTMTKEL
jgi:anti-sigma regulatory factor (Ser/Thr protein kinase)